MDRSKYIGSSDIAAIMGLSPWRTPLDVYLAKVDPQPEPEDEAKQNIFARGKVLEPLIVDAYARLYGVTITATNQSYAHPLHPYLASEIDAETTDGENLEIKSVHPFAARDWGPHGSDEIPLHYYCQVQYAMECSGAGICKVVAMFGFDEMRAYPIMRDKDVGARLVSAAVSFWGDVQNRIQPEPSNLDDCKRLWPYALDKTLDADESVIDRLVAYKNANDARKDAEKAEAAAKLELLKIIRDMEFVRSQTMHKLASYRNQETTRLDTTRLKKEQPDIFNQYAKTTHSRVLRLHGGL